MFRSKKKSVLKTFAIAIAIKKKSKQMPKNLLPYMPTGEMFFAMMPNAHLAVNIPVYFPDENGT